MGRVKSSVRRKRRRTEQEEQEEERNSKTPPFPHEPLNVFSIKRVWRKNNSC